MARRKGAAEVHREALGRAVLPGLVSGVLVAVLSLFAAPAVTFGSSSTPSPGWVAVALSTPQSEATVHRGVPGLAHTLLAAPWPLTVLPAAHGAMPPQFLGAGMGSRQAGEAGAGAIDPIQGRAPPATAL